MQPCPVSHEQAKPLPLGAGAARVQLPQTQPTWLEPPLQWVDEHDELAFVLNTHLNEPGAEVHSSKLTKPGPNFCPMKHEP